ITCAKRHVASDGSLLGVFTVDFNLNALSEFVRRLHFGDHGSVVILGSDAPPTERVVIAHPGLRVAEKPGQGFQGEIVKVADVRDPVLTTFLRLLSTRTPHAAATDEGQLVFEHDGERHLGAYRRLVVEGGPTWLLAAVTRESDFM